MADSLIDLSGEAVSAEVFAAVAKEAADVLGLPLVGVWRYDPDGSTATVMGVWSERPHPFEGGSRWPLDGGTLAAWALRERGMQSAAGAPIIVDGEVWGVMATASADRESLPDQIEDRLAEFTELVATAISYTEARAQLARLADEQAALRRVATLVARGVPPQDVFAAVAQEVGLLLGVEWTHMARYETDGTATSVARWTPTGTPMPVGRRFSLEGESVVGLVSRSGQPARMPGYDNATGPAAAVARNAGLRSSAGAPIIVDERLWGVMVASSKSDRPVPLDTESRIAAFAELVATAISNTEARAQLGRLADEQAALRRVATLVAQDVDASELFAAVTEEVGRLFAADLAGMIRYEADDTVSPVATWAADGEHPPVPDRWPMEEGDPATLVARTRRAERIDDWSDVPGQLAAFIREVAGITSSVGSPIIVEGRLWGALAVHSRQPDPLPMHTESRMENFSELIATAISNIDARAEVSRLADEQAALRRVATLVARGTPPEEVFAAVTEEVGRVLPVGLASLARYHHDGTMTTVARAAEIGDRFPVGGRWTLGGRNVSTLVAQTGRPARIDGYDDDDTSPLGLAIRERGFHSSVGSPIIVEGRLWGVMHATSRHGQPLPPDTEARLASFTELVATAIANAESRAELKASRARIVAATDEERRRVVRDLHDGAQQRLVHTIVTLKQARRALQNEQETAPDLVSEALHHAEDANVELRELAHGILPAVLIRGGLRAGVTALATRMPVPVDTDASVDRLPAAIEATAYLVVAEALTNVSKHSRAARGEVTARIEDGTLCVQVRDDGVGGAQPDGPGLIGLADRLAALDGRLEVESPAGGGTLVTATIPVPS